MPYKSLKHTKLNFTVDNTPHGFQTPEGRARGIAALEREDEARIPAFYLMRRIYNPLVKLIEDEPTKSLADFAAVYHDQLTGAAEAYKEWQEAASEVLLSAAGIPPKS